ncbi:MAG TPA: DUF4383 domain-containing protein [Terriglobales bacterium]|nr:DUF4383 domain-containing protein [Terriglobales bacterium]
MAKAYALVVGAVLLVVGICGFLMPSMLGMQFGKLHNGIHILSGLIGLYCGLAAGGRNAGAYAKIFGAVYTLIAIAGFAGWSGALFNNMSLHLSTAYNAVHAVVGIAGLAAGFMSAGARKAEAAGA